MSHQATATPAAPTASPLRRMLSKMRGGGRSPLAASGKDAVLSALGGFIGIALIALLTAWTHTEWLMPPFGATCVLLFAIHQAPFSQPRNIIGGHLLSSAIGLAVGGLLGSGPWALAIAVALAIAAMIGTKTTHPPAGADPLLIILSHPAWTFLIAPVLLGSVTLVVVGLIFHNLLRDRRYPLFWL